jgi:hypothetical protein
MKNKILSIFITFLFILSLNALARDITDPQITDYEADAFSYLDIDSDLIESEKEFHCNKIISKKYHIELEGYFDKAFHFIYLRNPVNDIHLLMMSIIRFDDADVSINYNEFCNQGSGILFICFYNGVYKHNSDKETLIINGDAWYLNIFLN